MAQAYLEEGEIEAAGGVLDGALSKGTTPDRLRVAGRLALGRGDWAKAEKWLSQAVRDGRRYANPRYDDLAWLCWAELDRAYQERMRGGLDLLRQGKHGEALAVFEGVCDTLKPSNPLLQSALANLCLVVVMGVKAAGFGTKEKARARVALERLRVLNPGHERLPSLLRSLQVWGSAK